MGGQKGSAPKIYPLWQLSPFTVRYSGELLPGDGPLPNDYGRPLLLSALFSGVWMETFATRGASSLEERPPEVTGYWRDSHSKVSGDD